MILKTNMIVLLSIICFLLTSTLGAQTKVMISTDFGDMIVELYDDTPLHKENFINNIKSGVYDGSLFHRVIPFFMMQGGDPASRTAGPFDVLGSDSCGQIPAEISPNRYHKKGALAAARLPDNVNPEKKSSGCQFFIVQGYPHNDNQIASSGKTVTAHQKAWYKVRGGMPFLDNDYTVFGEVIDGLEVIDLIHAVPTQGANGAKDRPTQDVKMSITILEE